MSKLNSSWLSVFLFLSGVVTGVAVEMLAVKWQLNRYTTTITTADGRTWRVVPDEDAARQGKPRVEPPDDDRADAFVDRLEAAIKLDSGWRAGVDYRETGVLANFPRKGYSTTVGRKPPNTLRVTVRNELTGNAEDVEDWFNGKEHDRLWKAMMGLEERLKPRKIKLPN